MRSSAVVHHGCERSLGQFAEVHCSSPAHRQFGPLDFHTTGRPVVTSKREKVDGRMDGPQARESAAFAGTRQCGLVSIAPLFGLRMTAATATAFKFARIHNRNGGNALSAAVPACRGKLDGEIVSDCRSHQGSEGFGSKSSIDTSSGRPSRSMRSESGPGSASNRRRNSSSDVIGRSE